MGSRHAEYVAALNGLRPFANLAAGRRS